MDPGRLFLHLTQWTVPYPNEEKYYGALLTALAFEKDAHGNWFREIATPSGRSTTAFMAHMDTACREAEPISRIIESGIVRTNGSTILGADDRAGMTVLISLLSRRVPGLYCLFVGEEKGCVGSSAVAESDPRFEGILRAVSFDRMGTDEIITHQCGIRTCSHAFAAALCDAFKTHDLRLRPSDEGIYTDSFEFIHRIPECTNLSVGYQNMHWVKETQDLRFLRKICKAAAKVDWEALPVARNLEEEVYERDWFRGDYTRSYDRGSSKHSEKSFYGQDSWCEEWDYSAPEAAIERIVEAFGNGQYPGTYDLGIITDGSKKQRLDILNALFFRLHEVCW
jgi:hypothetical protein